MLAKRKMRKMEIKFTKMHGSGNDFILVDEWEQIQVPEVEKEEFVRAACARHFGVGADGAVFIQKSEKADVNFVFYNPDGSRAEMCGNGIRCLAKYVFEHGLLAKESLDVETAAGTKHIDLAVEDGKVTEVKVDMGAPQVRRGEAQVVGDGEETFIKQKVMIHGFEYTITAVGMGNPHAVLFYDDIDGVNVREIGRRIREYTNLFPNGVNVHYVQGGGDNEFKVRTYERGVEDETLACGTGICACAVACVLNGKADPAQPIIFHAKGGDVRVELEMKGNIVKRVYLIGPAEEVYTGKIKV